MPEIELSDLTTITVNKETGRKLDAFSLDGKFAYDEVINRLLLSLMLASDKPRW